MLYRQFRLYVVLSTGLPQCEWHGSLKFTYYYRLGVVGFGWHCSVTSHSDLLQLQLSAYFRFIMIRFSLYVRAGGSHARAAKLCVFTPLLWAATFTYWDVSCCEALCSSLTSYSQLPLHTIHFFFLLKSFCLINSDLNEDLGERSRPESLDFLAIKKPRYVWISKEILLLWNCI